MLRSFLFCLSRGGGLVEIMCQGCGDVGQWGREEESERSSLRGVIDVRAPVFPSKACSLGCRVLSKYPGDIGVLGGTQTVWRIQTLVWMPWKAPLPQAGFVSS